MFSSDIERLHRHRLHRRYRDGLRDIYRDLATEFNVPLVPFLLEGIARDEALLQEDGLHPTAEAQPKVLENVWGVLGPLL